MLTGIRNIIAVIIIYYLL